MSMNVNRTVSNRVAPALPALSRNRRAVSVVHYQRPLPDKDGVMDKLGLSPEQVSPRQHMLILAAYNMAKGMKPQKPQTSVPVPANKSIVEQLGLSPHQVSPQQEKYIELLYKTAQSVLADSKKQAVNRSQTPAQNQMGLNEMMSRLRWQYEIQKSAEDLEYTPTPRIRRERPVRPPVIPSSGGGGSLGQWSLNIPMTAPNINWPGVRHDLWEGTKWTGNKIKDAWEWMGYIIDVSNLHREGGHARGNAGEGGVSSSDSSTERTATPSITESEQERRLERERNPDHLPDSTYGIDPNLARGTHIVGFEEFARRFTRGSNMKTIRKAYNDLERRNRIANQRQGNQEVLIPVANGTGYMPPHIPTAAQPYGAFNPSNIIYEMG